MKFFIVTIPRIKEKHRLKLEQQVEERQREAELLEQQKLVDREFNTSK